MNARFVLPRETRMEALLVDRAVVLRVDDDLHIDAAVDRRLQRVERGRVAELVEAAAQRVALLRCVDEAKHRVVEVAAEPSPRFRGLVRGQLIGFLVLELASVRLAARDAAIEVDIAFEVAEERLGVDPDLDRIQRNECARLSLHRNERVAVMRARLRGEVIPYETLDGMVPGRHAGRLVRVGDQRFEDLEPRDGLGLTLRVRTFDGEPEETLPRRRGRADAEGHGVDARHCEHLEPSRLR